MIDKRNYSLLGHNTFGIDATCRRFVEYSSVEEAQELVHNLTEEDYPLLIIGSGSNLLLTADYPGTVLHSAIKGIEVLNTNNVESSKFNVPSSMLNVESSKFNVPSSMLNVESSKFQVPSSKFQVVRCGSGEVWDDVVAWSLKHNLYGAENLSIIPGEVGASAVQNIGAYGAEAKDLIFDVEAVEIATGNLVHFSNADCEYSYRQSKFKHEWRDKYLITHVTYKFNSEFKPDLDYGNIRSALAERGITTPTAMDVRNTVIDIRNAKLPDPRVQGNAGSFFMNPIVDESEFSRLKAEFPNLRYFEVKAADGKSTMYKIPAGWMIDQCGWKGKSLGKAGVHDKQALVLVNRGGATGNDVVNLMHAVQHDVKEKFGLDIHPEVNIKP